MGQLFTWCSPWSTKDFRVGVISHTLDFGGSSSFSSEEYIFILLVMSNQLVLAPSTSLKLITHSSTEDEHYISSAITVKNSAEAQNWKHTKTLFTRDYLLTVTSVVRFSKPARDFYHTRPARRKLASSAILSRAITTSLWNTWPRTTLFIRTMHFRVRFVDTGLARESYWKLTLRWFMRSSACPVICVNSSRRTRVQ